MVSTVVPPSTYQGPLFWASQQNNNNHGKGANRAQQQQRRRYVKKKDPLGMGGSTSSTVTTSPSMTTRSYSSGSSTGEFQNLKWTTPHGGVASRNGQEWRGMAVPVGLPVQHALGNFRATDHVLVSGPFVTPDGKRPLQTSPFTTATEALTWYSGGSVDANPEVTPELHWLTEGAAQEQEQQAWPPRSFHYISGSDMSGTSSAMSSPRMTHEDAASATWSPWSPKTAAVKMLNPPMLPFMGPLPMRHATPPRSPPAEARRQTEDEEEKRSRRKNRRRRRRRRGEDEEDDDEEMDKEGANFRTERRDDGRIVTTVSSSSSSNSPTRLSPTRNRVHFSEGGTSATSAESPIAVRGESSEAVFVNGNVEPHRYLGRRQLARRPSLVFVDEVHHRPSLLEWRQANLDHGVESLEYDTLSQMSQEEALAAQNRMLRGQAASPSSFLSSGIELSYSNDEMDDEGGADVLADLGAHTACHFKDRRGKSVRTIDTFMSEPAHSPWKSICVHVGRLFGNGFTFCDPKEQPREHSLMDRRRATIRSYMTDGHEMSLHGENLLAEDDVVVVVRSEEEEMAEELSVDEPQSPQKKIFDASHEVSAPTSKETCSNPSLEPQEKEIVARPEMVQRNMSTDSYDVSQDSMAFQSRGSPRRSPLCLQRQSSTASEVSQLTEADFDLDDSGSSSGLSPVRLTIQTSVSEDPSLDRSGLPPTGNSRETPTSSDSKKNAHLSRPPLIRGRTTDGTFKKMTNRARANTGNSLMSMQSRGSMRSVSSISSLHRRTTSAVFSEGSIALICTEANKASSPLADAPPRPTHIRHRSRSISKTLEEIGVENREDLVVSPIPDETDEDRLERPLPLGRSASDAVHDAIDSRKVRSVEKMRGSGGRPPRHVVRATTVGEARVQQDLLRKFEQSEVRVAQDEVEEEAEVFLPISFVFREEVRRRGLTGRVVVEGWVAFSKGERLLEQLSTGALLKRRDYCYISMTDDDDYLHVFRRSSNGPDRFKVMSLNLSRDLVVESRCISKRVGQATVVRDARRDAVVCVLVATSMKSGQFQDADFSVVVPDKLLHAWTTREVASCGQSEAALHLQFTLDAALRRRRRRRQEGN